MRKYISDEKGISLVLTLLMLVFVGILSAALLSSTVYNIRFGVSEVDQEKAFYGAEAGVEYARTALMDIAQNGGLSQLVEYDLDSNEVFLVSAEDSGDNDYFAVLGDDISEEKEAYQVLDDGQLEFVVEMIENDDEVIFASRGHVNGHTREVEFGLDLEFLVEAAFLLNIENLNGNINPDSSEFYDYVKWDAAEGELKKEHIKFADIYDILGVSSWWEFLDINKGEGGFVEVDFLNNKVDDFLEFTEKETWNLEDFIEDEEANDDYRKAISDEKVFFTDNPVQIGYNSIEWPEEDKEDFQGWIYGEEEYKILTDDGEHYKLSETIPPYDADSYDSWSDYKDNYRHEHDKEYWSDPEGSISEFEYTGNIGIEDSIVIVDGNMDIRGNANLKNSLVLVRGHVEVGGRTDLDNSLILGFDEWADDPDEEDREHMLTVSGAPSIELDLLKNPPEGEGWSYIDKVFQEVGDSVEDYSIEFWRQTR